MNRETNKKLTPIFYDDYIEKNVNVDFSQKELSLILPALENQIDFLDAKADGGFASEVWKEERDILQRVWDILDDEYYAKEAVEKDDTWYNEGEEVL